MPTIPIARQGIVRVDSGNGVDLGRMVAMLSDVLDGQQALRADVQDIKSVVNQHTRVLNEHTVTLAGHGRRLDDLTGQVNSLREAVTAYHASVLGHGILISELDARVRRIEHHLDLPPAA